MKNLTLAQIANSIDGKLVLPEGYAYEKTKEVEGVVIDNRQVEKDYLFIPIKGARVDGHSFISDAFAKGAMAVLSEHELPEAEGPYILVEDTQIALKSLAAFYRSGLDTYVIGIVGSVGKTSTKEMVASVLSQHFQVLKTQGNFNNEIGLPLTLFRIRKEHQVAVVEMGISDFGEMDRLGKMAKPDMVIMTNIGLCHLENLKSRDGILKAKTEVFAHMPEDGVIVLNGDDDKLQIADTEGRKTIYFGLHDQEFSASGIQGDLMSVCASIHTPDFSCEVRIPIPGEHNVYNALAAMVAASVLQMSQEEMIAGVETVETIDGRNNFITHKDMVIIDDCYNANPVSMKASLEVLSHATGRKVAVLGDMGELGAQERQLHYQVGEAVVACGIDLLFTAGTLSKEIARAVEEIGGKKQIQVFSFDTKEEMTEALLRTIKKGDTILVKASHFMNFPEVVTAITESL